MKEKRKKERKKRKERREERKKETKQGGRKGMGAGDTKSAGDVRQQERQVHPPVQAMAECSYLLGKVVTLG